MKTDLLSYYSTQLTNTTSRPPVMNETNDYVGRVRIARFDYTAAAALAADSEIGLCLIPANARVIGGAYKHSAYGAGRTLDIGLKGADGSGYIDVDESVADDPDYFVDGDDVSAAGADSIAEIVNSDLNAEAKITKECVLTAKIIGDTFPVDGTLNGHIKYVLD